MNRTVQQHDESNQHQHQHPAAWIVRGKAAKGKKEEKRHQQKHTAKGRRRADQDIWTKQVMHPWQPSTAKETTKGRCDNHQSTSIAWSRLTLFFDKRSLLQSVTRQPRQDLVSTTCVACYVLFPTLFPFVVSFASFA
jgi:hypothetical protein